MSNQTDHHDYEQSSVDASQKRSFWSMFVIMMGFTFFSASMWVGLTLANGDPKIGFSGLSFSNFVWAVLAGNVILGLYTGLLAYPAAKTGLSVHLLARYSFGTRGSNIPSTVLAVTQIGWFGVGVAMFAIPAAWWLTDASWLQGTWFVGGPREGFFGADKLLPLRLLWTLTVLSGIVMTSSAYFGIKALHIISVVSVPAIAVLGGWSAIHAVFLDSPEQIAANNSSILASKAAEAFDKPGVAEALEAVFSETNLVEAAKAEVAPFDKDGKIVASIHASHTNALARLEALRAGADGAAAEFVPACEEFVKKVPGVSEKVLAAIKDAAPLPSGREALVNHQPAPAGDNADGKGGASILIAMVIAISLGIGSFVSGGSCTPDFTRFAKTPRIAVSTTVLAFFIGNSLMFFFGGAAAMVYGKNDISNVMFIQGLLLPAVVVLLLNIWTTNDNALYTSGLGLANITGLPKRFLVLFNGALGTVAALWLYNHFCGWLTILNTFIPPCGAILIADFFVRAKRRYPDMKDKKFVCVSPPAVVAWALGSIVALGGFDYLVHAKWLQFGIPAINGMVVAAVVYLALSAVCPCTKKCKCDACETK